VVALPIKKLQKCPGRSAEAVATTVGGVYSERGEVGSIRGARAEATVYIIDGVKVRGTTALPKSATAQVDVIMGGIPAKYGDVTGGIISITTKEPSRETHGSIELSTSKFLDPYGYYLAEGSITGPLFSKKYKDPYDSTKTKKDVKAGYFLTASFNYEKDNAPSVIGMWKAKDGVVDDILANPYRTNETGFGTLLNAEFLRSDKFEKVKARSDVGQKQMMLQGKVDFKVSKNVSLTVGATYDHQQNRLFSYANTLFNSNNNGEAIDNTFRGFVRFTQKFQSADEKENATALIKNAYYHVQLDYNYFNEIVQDPRHKDHLFNYGYVGKFTTEKVRSYSYTDTVPGYSSRSLATRWF
jgi:Outer membrane receptor for ferrienterochelin and colicins